MKLFITLGTTDGERSHTVELKEGEFATYLGVELAVPVDEDHFNGVTTILRTSFQHHGLNVHTLCHTDNNDIEKMEY